MFLNRYMIAVAVAVMFIGCAESDGGDAELRMQAVEMSAPEASGEPSLFTTDDGNVLMSWFEVLDSAQTEWAIRVAQRDGDGWSEPRTVVERRSFFVNWADFPAVSEQSDGTWVVHWLEKTEGSPYAYHVLAARSADEGVSWSAPVKVHGDDSPTEHGFVSHVPLPDGGTQLLWLDGRNTGGEDGAMNLRTGVLGAEGNMGDDQLIDDRICDCCQTAMVRTSSGALVAAYRDRSSEGEIRDIAVRRMVDGAWSEPMHVGNDNWHMPACPVNGPALATAAADVVIAWFAAPEEVARVQVAFSSDEGATFGEAIRVDDGSPLGRVDVELLSDGSLFVIWLEAVGEEAEIRARRVFQDGHTLDSWLVAKSSQVRRSGFPKVTPFGDGFLFAWTLPGEGGGVRVSLGSVPLD